MGSVSVGTTTMPFEGFIAVPSNDTGWVCGHAGEMPAGLADKVVAATRQLLGGQRGYAIGRRTERPEMRKVFGGRWRSTARLVAHRLFRMARQDGNQRGVGRLGQWKCR